MSRYQAMNDAYELLETVGDYLSAMDNPNEKEEFISIELTSLIVHLALEHGKSIDEPVERYGEWGRTRKHILKRAIDALRDVEEALNADELTGEESALEHDLVGKLVHLARAHGGKVNCVVVPADELLPVQESLREIRNQVLDTAGEVSKIMTGVR